jgi:hypothetical protein
MAMRAALLFAGVPAAAGFENMNGAYVISKTPGATDTKFNTKWGECAFAELSSRLLMNLPPDPTLAARAVKNELGGVESFDLYVGPITSLYSQVWWTGLPAVELPDAIKKQFNDSAMAIMGCESILV